MIILYSYPHLLLCYQLWIQVVQEGHQPTIKVYYTIQSTLQVCLKTKEKQSNLTNYSQQIAGVSQNKKKQSNLTNYSQQTKHENVHLG